MPTSSLQAPSRRGTDSHCSICRRQAACFVAAIDPDAGESRHTNAHRKLLLAPGDRLYRLGRRCDALYQVCRGSLKTQRETAEGDLIVTGFYLPGDLVGVDALADRVFPSDAIACGETELCRIDFTNLLSDCARSPGMNAWILAAVGCYVRRKDSDLSWSGSQQSRQRVLRFFIDLHDRLARPGVAPCSPLAMPMKKQDIARYLHLTPETLSRNLAQLKTDDLLLVIRNRFVLPDVELARAAAGL